MELYQWLNMQESREFSKTNKKEIESEVADILNYLILFTNDLDIDLLEVTDRKLRVNKKKYPVRKAKGNSTKYNRYKG